MKHLLQHFKTLTKHSQNAEELKGLILQLAIQGKLTESWRACHPELVSGSNSASKLLKRIKEEKKVLITQKKLKKEKPLPEIERDEVVFDLPKDWAVVRINEISALKAGGDVPKARFSKEKTEEYNIPIFANGEKNKGLYGYTDIPVITEPSLTVSGRGTIGYTELRIEPFYPIVRLIVITPFSISIDLDYLKFVLQSTDFQNTGTSIPQLTVPKLKEKCIVPLPPLEEQKAIVDIVNELLAEVEQLEEATKTSIQLKEDFVTSALQRLSQVENVNQEWQFLQTHFTDFFTEKENVKQLRETILQLAVQGKLTSKWRSCHPELVSGSHHASELLKRIQAEKQKLIAQKKIKKEKPLPPIEDLEKPYDLPNGWVWCRMQEIGLFERGKSKHRPRNDRRLFNDGNYPLVQTGDVSSSKNTGGLITTNKSFYNEFGLAQSRMWKKGTLCITIAANIAETGFLGFDACFPDSVVGFTDLLDNDDSLSKYVDCFITVTKSDLEKYAPSTAQKNINLGILYQLIFPLPPLEEQKAIVKQVNALMALCDSLEEQITNNQTQIEQLMQSCLREVFN